MGLSSLKLYCVNSLRFKQQSVCFIASLNEMGLFGIYSFWILFLFFNFGTCQNQKRGSLIWQEEFDKFNLTLWKHWVTTWLDTPSEFQYFTNNRTNRFGGYLYRYKNVLNSNIF